MSKHTCIGLSVTYSDDQDNGRFIINHEGVLIADCYADTYLTLGLPDKEDVKPNAEFIVRACNNHQPLIDTCARLITWLYAIRDKNEQIVIESGYDDGFNLTEAQAVINACIIEKDSQ